MSKYLIGFSTNDQKEEAENIAQTLVNEGLVACVNIVPKVQSIYKWQGKVCNETELLSIIKTTAENAEKVTAKIKEMHHYEVPEIVFFDINGGSSDYLNWITESLLF